MTFWHYLTHRAGERVDNYLSDMNEAEFANRVIALDEALDEIIFARGENLAIELANQEETKRSGILPKIAGAAAGAGLVYGGVKYRKGLGKVARRAGRAAKERAVGAYNKVKYRKAGRGLMAPPSQSY